MSNYVINAPKHSFKNKAAIESSDQCGCYQCLEIFSAREITHWTDQHQTAICPKCNIDSVLAESSMQAMNTPLTKENLKKLYDWFFTK